MQDAPDQILHLALLTFGDPAAATLAVRLQSRASKTRCALLCWVMQEGDYQDTIVVPLLSTFADYVGLRIQPGQFAGYSVRQEDAGLFCLASQAAALAWECRGKLELPVACGHLM